MIANFDRKTKKIQPNSCFNNNFPTEFSGLSSSARNALGYLATHPDLIIEFAVNCENVWTTLEDKCGTISLDERQVLAKLYQVFLAPGSSTPLFTDIELVDPLMCWIGPECPGPN
ncbi:MAG TPA: hypothetical protein VH186_09590 [Chloroflexia bacterium]|nr:hypothetical protein [Chloroflexia bacterium]